MCKVEYDKPRKTATCIDCSKTYRETREVYYDQLAEVQEHLCAICGSPENSVSKLGRPRRLAVDHCHATGKVRALLCFRCNVMLGSAADDPERLEKATAYLRAHQAETTA